MGIRIFRFYFKCTKCSAELSIKANPQNSHYDVEFGVTTNFEPWRKQDVEIEKRKEAKGMGNEKF